MAVFTLETDYSRETGYPFDEIVFYFWMNNPPDFIRQFRRTIWRRDCPFQMASVQPPPPLWKNRRSGCQWGGRDCTQASLRRISISSSSVKTANNKIPESSVFNDSEGLYGTTVCRCLVRSGHVVLASSPPKCLDRDCVGRRRTGTRHGNVYRVASEKNREILFIGNVFYKQWHLCVLFY